MIGNVRSKERYQRSMKVCGGNESLPFCSKTGGGKILLQPLLLLLLNLLVRLLLRPLQVWWEDGHLTLLLPLLTLSLTSAALSLPAYLSLLSA